MNWLLIGCAAYIVAAALTIWWLIGTAMWELPWWRDDWDGGDPDAPE